MRLVVVFVAVGLNLSLVGLPSMSTLEEGAKATTLSLRIFLQMSQYMILILLAQIVVQRQPYQPITLRSRVDVFPMESTQIAEHGTMVQRHVVRRKCDTHFLRMCRQLVSLLFVARL